MLSFFNNKNSSTSHHPAIRSSEWALVPATEEDYANFLIARVEAGGNIGTFYSRPFKEDRKDHFDRDNRLEALVNTGLSMHPRHNIFYATQDCDVPALYGASSIDIIVPKGLEVTTSGHNDILSMETPLKSSAPALYSNMLTRDNNGYVFIGEHTTLTKEHMERPELDWQDVVAAARLKVTSAPGTHRKMVGHNH